ncbi:MAG: DinB family protein [Cyclobacteriaceae bacterium]
MKKLLLLTTFIFSIGLVVAQEGAISDEERSTLVEQLKASQKHLMSNVEGLSDAQWNYKASDTTWSIAETAEHIAIAEQGIFGGAQMALQSETKEMAEGATEKDGKLTGMLSSREHKVKTSPNMEPTGKYATPQDFIAAYTEISKATTAFAQTTDAPLRAHAAPFGPLGDMDAYQWLLAIPAHCQRHCGQIEEVMADAGYPAE